MFFLGAWRLYTTRGFRHSLRNAYAGWVLLRRVPSRFFSAGMVLQPFLELAFILDQKMRKQKKTTRKRKNLRLRLPEQQFDAVSCQLSSAGKGYFSAAVTQALAPQNCKRPPANHALEILLWLYGDFLPSRSLREAFAGLRGEASECGKIDYQQNTRPVYCPITFHR